MTNFSGHALKKFLLAATIASALLAHAATQAAPSKSIFVETLAAAGRELGAATGGQRDVVKKMELYSKFEFSPELRPRLKQVFGSDHPFKLALSTGPNDRVTYVAKLAPNTYHDENAMAFSWTEFSVTTITNKSGSVLHNSGSWPSLSLTGASGSLVAEKMGFEFKSSRGKDGGWYGGGGVKLGSAVMRSTTPDAANTELMRIEDVAFSGRATRQGKKAEMAYGLSVKSLQLGADRVEGANIGVRLVNVPMHMMASMDAALENLQSSGLASDAETQVMQKTFQRFAKDLIISGASLVIDDVSAGYLGNKASIKGRVGFNKVVESDFSAPLELARKIVARFDVRLPVSMVNDVSRAVAARSVDKQAPDSVQQIETASKNIADMVMGKLLNEGFAVMEKGALRSAIEIKNGKLTVNGKAVSLPAMSVGDLAKASSWPGNGVQ